jgi:hypothetical protein
MMKILLEECLNLEEGTDTLSRNVGRELRFYVAYNTRKGNISFTSRPKPELTHPSNF